MYMCKYLCFKRVKGIKKNKENQKEKLNIINQKLKRQTRVLCASSFIKDVYLMNDIY